MSPPSSPSLQSLPTAREVFEERAALISIASTHLAVLSRQCKFSNNEHITTYKGIENDKKVITIAIDGFREVVGDYLKCMAYGYHDGEFVRKCRS
jgi:hypothetical protein